MESNWKIEMKNHLIIFGVCGLASLRLGVEGLYNNKNNNNSTTTIHCK